MLVKLCTAAVTGINSNPIDVEVSLTKGLASFIVVGLADNTIKESRERVTAAINNSGYAFPLRKIVINLAPAEIRKSGAGFDLPMAIGILQASEVIAGNATQDYMVFGELSMDGSLRHTNCVLSVAILARQMGLKGLIVPLANAAEAAMVEDLTIHPAQSLAEVVDFLCGRKVLHQPSADKWRSYNASGLTIDDVRGQEQAKRALAIAASGFHHMLMIGPPGTGKSMLAKRIPSLMPPLRYEEALETSQVYSSSGLLTNDQPLIAERPFRAPHHSTSRGGLIGGGSIPNPGEISFANHGVLFLDELPEFPRAILDTLRQPLEEYRISIARASARITYPCRFLMICAMNPCPCGYFGAGSNRCRCSQRDIIRYRRRISGPFIDRIDIQIDVPAVPPDKLLETQSESLSETLNKRVQDAVAMQQERFAKSEHKFNGLMDVADIQEKIQLSENCNALLKNAIDKLLLSARAYHRILRIARTIADMESSAEIETAHIAEAIQYRKLDRYSYETI